MTCERADDKCESCGELLEEIQFHADFADIIYCTDCRIAYVPNWAVAEEFDDIMGFLSED